MPLLHRPTLVLLALLAAASAGHAAVSDLQGATVQVIWRYPDAVTTYLDAGIAVVGPGIEFPSSKFAGNTAVSVDFSSAGNVITITSADNGGSGAWDSKPFNGLEFLLVSAAGPFTGATLASASGAWSGLPGSAVTFTGTSVFLNLQGEAQSLGNQVEIHYTLAVADAGRTASLVGLPLMGFLILRARRRRVPA